MIDARDEVSLVTRKKASTVSLTETIVASAVLSLPMELIKIICEYNDYPLFIRQEAQSIVESFQRYFDRVDSVLSKQTIHFSKMMRLNAIYSLIAAETRFDILFKQSYSTLMDFDAELFTPFFSPENELPVCKNFLGNYPDDQQLRNFFQDYAPQKKDLELGMELFEKLKSFASNYLALYQQQKLVNGNLQMLPFYIGGVISACKESSSELTGPEMDNLTSLVVDLEVANQLIIKWREEGLSSFNETEQTLFYEFLKPDNILLKLLLKAQQVLPAVESENCERAIKILKNLIDEHDCLKEFYFVQANQEKPNDKVIPSVFTFFTQPKLADRPATECLSEVGLKAKL